jgi:hypothetical protein
MVISGVIWQNLGGLCRKQESGQGIATMHGIRHQTRRNRGTKIELGTEEDYNRQAAFGNRLSGANTYLFPTMVYLPYHHDWKLAFETDLGLRVHWFGRYAGFPEWKAERSGWRRT